MKRVTLALALCMFMGCGKKVEENIEPVEAENHVESDKTITDDSADPAGNSNKSIVANGTDCQGSGDNTNKNKNEANESVACPSPNLLQEKFTIPGLELALVPVKECTFMMGYKELSQGNLPHRVTITHGFLVGATEVTQAQYESIMGKNPSRFKGADNPVERVTWYESVDFCKKLTDRERAAGRLPATEEYRLPTEAEWECCCRVGTDTEFFTEFLRQPMTDYAWCESNSGGKTHPVGMKKPNCLGVYDIAGNVFEFCLDHYTESRGKENNETEETMKDGVIDPLCQTGNLRVRRGGCWNLVCGFCNTSGRVFSYPDHRSERNGFRIVRAVIGPKNVKRTMPLADDAVKRRLSPDTKPPGFLRKRAMLHKGAKPETVGEKKWWDELKTKK